MQLRFGFATDVGRKRAKNQDAVAAVPELGLFIVADGMGGHNGGETASSMTVEIITDVVRKADAQGKWTPRRVLTDAIQTANHLIYERSAREPALQGMGTTCTALLFKDGALTIGHVGDSRCYFFRRGGMWQATRDHSLVAEKIRAGLITRLEAKTDRMKNVITRSVGFEPQVNVEVYELKLEAGDAFLICSDGLSGEIEDPEVHAIIRENLFPASGNPDPGKAVEQLIDVANRNGGEDNISSVLIEVSEQSE